MDGRGSLAQESAPVTSHIDRAVILAAGFGSRIQGTTGTPKPLVEVAGRTLLERTITTLRAAGVTDIAVIVGHRADEIRAAAAGLGVRFVDNPEYEKSNGVSVACARSHMAMPFLLSMSDHVFDVMLPQRAARADMSTADLWLCVDRKIDDVFDPDDATKVATKGDAIVAIAKDLKTYDAIDTGVFAVGGALLDELDSQRRARGDCSLSDGVRALAARGRARVIDVTGAFWQDVDTPEARERAERILAG